MAANLGAESSNAKLNILLMCLLSSGHFVVLLAVLFAYSIRVPTYNFARFGGCDMGLLACLAWLLQP